MKTLRTVTQIRARPEIVWDVLTDFAHYPNWNPFIIALDGDLDRGARLRATVAIAGHKPRTLSHTLTCIEPTWHLAWRGHLAVPGLFDAEHELHLQPSDTGTRLTHQETFRGALPPLLHRTLAATREAFVDMDVALRQLAEACQAEPRRHWHRPAAARPTRAVVSTVSLTAP